MKKMMKRIKRPGFFFLLLTALTACNKEGAFTKAIAINIKGYNIGNSALEVAIDEVTYDKFMLPANQQVNFAKVYTYPSNKSQALLRIKDITPAKEVFQQKLQLNNGELELFFPFVMINGTPLEIKPPAADLSTNKVAFYVHYPQSSDAIDIFLKDDAGQIAYIAKNVLPSTWVYTNYLTDKAFTKSIDTYTLYFTKTGTTSTWAFMDSEGFSKCPTATLFLPNFGQKGQVCSYFITPSTNQLDAVRLFKGPN